MFLIIIPEVPGYGSDDDDLELGSFPHSVNVGSANVGRHSSSAPGSGRYDEFRKQLRLMGKSLLCVCLFVCVFVCVCICLCVYLFVCWFVCLYCIS